MRTRTPDTGRGSVHSLTQSHLAIHRLLDPAFQAVSPTVVRLGVAVLARQALGHLQLETGLDLDPEPDMDHGGLDRRLGPVQSCHHLVCQPEAGIRPEM